MARESLLFVERKAEKYQVAPEEPPTISTF